MLFRKLNSVIGPTNQKLVKLLHGETLDVKVTNQIQKN